MSKIKSLCAREIIDSRGVPTVEVEIELISRHSIIASVPSGASTGKFEAFAKKELRLTSIPIAIPGGGVIVTLN